jgi:uncharacterized membrane protein
VSEDPLDRAHRNAQLCLGLLGAVIVLSIAFSVIASDPRYMLAGALVGGGGSALVFWAFASGTNQ